LRGALDTETGGAGIHLPLRVPQKLAQEKGGAISCSPHEQQPSPSWTRRRSLGTEN
jgi:hypothetical protein